MNDLVLPQAWNTAETIAVITLIVTMFGLGFTVFNTYQTSQRTQEVLESSLRAVLEIPRDPHRDGERNEFADGGLRVGEVANLTDGGPHVQITGAVQNVGRYPALNVELLACHGLRPVRIMNPPWEILESYSPPSEFDLLLPVSSTDPADLASGLPDLFSSGPIWLTFMYQDGNPGTKLLEPCFSFKHDATKGRWLSQRVQCST
jgi:hypothetical protein